VSVTKSISTPAFSFCFNAPNALDFPNGYRYNLFGSTEPSPFKIFTLQEAMALSNASQEAPRPISLIRLSVSLRENPLFALDIPALHLPNHS
jgi:hypothetical protein